MAHIKEIRFTHVGRNEGCLCDKCGQYIQNIVTVEFTDGITFDYGQDCFKKLYDNSKLTEFGKKLMRHGTSSETATDTDSSTTSTSGTGWNQRRIRDSVPCLSERG